MILVKMNRHKKHKNYIVIFFLVTAYKYIFINITKYIFMVAGHLPYDRWFSQLAMLHYPIVFPLNPIKSLFVDG